MPSTGSSTKGLLFIYFFSSKNYLLLDFSFRHISQQEKLHMKLYYLKETWGQNL